MRHLHRRRFVSAAVGALPFAAATPAAAKTAAEAVCAPGKDRERYSWIYTKYFQDEVVLGNPEATVSVTEYISPGAIHCAKWHREVFPQARKRFIDTGSVRWAIREMVVGPEALCFPVFLLARRVAQTDRPSLVDGKRYLAVLEAVFAVQDKIFERRETDPFLIPIAKRFGLTEDNYREAISDWGEIGATVRRCAAAEDVAGIQALPTLFVGNQELSGSNVSLADLTSAVERAGRL